MSSLRLVMKAKCPPVGPQLGLCSERAGAADDQPSAAEGGLGDLRLTFFGVIDALPGVVVDRLHDGANGLDHPHLAHLSVAQGASTITEQVAKLVYLGGSDRSPWRKLQEAAVAFKLEDRYSKEQILGAYLNSAYFGDAAYGIDAASRRYFAVAPRQLDLAQASLLAGLPQAPSADDPFAHPRAARRRQVAVLRSLVRTGFVTQAEAARALARPLRLRDRVVLPVIPRAGVAPGPAFVWWELIVGGALLAAGVAGALLARRRPAGLARVACLAATAILLVIGLGTVVRSFRVA